MKENQFGFEYSWDGLRPIRPLMVVVLIAEGFGALLGLWLRKYPVWFDSLWVGAVTAAFPGFLVGVVIQKFVQLTSFSEN